MERRRFGWYKEFYYDPDKKHEDIREKLIELIKEMDLTNVSPEWETFEVIFHDYLYGPNPAGPSTIAIKFCSSDYKYEFGGEP